MKKLVIGIVGAVAVLGLSILGTSISSSKDGPVKAKADEKVVYNVEDDERLSSGSLSDAITATSMFLYGVIYSEVDFEEDADSLQVVDTYVKGAVKWAEKVNASEEIKTILNESAALIEKGIGEQNIESLKIANDKLLELNKSYHEPYWREYDGGQEVDF